MEESKISEIFLVDFNFLLNVVCCSSFSRLCFSSFVSNLQVNWKACIEVQKISRGYITKSFRLPSDCFDDLVSFKSTFGMYLRSALVKVQITLIFDWRSFL